MARFHLVDTSTDEDLGIYDASSEDEARKFVSEDHPDREQDWLKIYPEILAPELQGNAPLDAQLAFERVVRRFVARCRSTQTDEQITALVQSNFSDCVVQQAVSLDARMPYLTLMNPDMASSVEYVAIRALGDAELDRIELWARNDLRQRTRPQDGFIDASSTHLYRFVSSEFLHFWRRPSQATSTS